ncbi:MAG: radical SAM protein [Planctomycetota bacterium]
MNSVCFTERKSQLEDHGDKFAGLFCPTPFEFAQVDSLGAVFLCCPQHIQYTPAGDLTQQNFMEAWNSEQAQAMRSSIIDGSFKYCSEAMCGSLQSRTLLKVDSPDSPYRHIIETGITRLNRGPITINLAYDRSCNLACPSCRNDFNFYKGNAKQLMEMIEKTKSKAEQRLELIHNRVIGSHIKDAQRLIITGSGDPFGSKLYFKFLQDYDLQAAPDLRISLCTNGLLFTEKTWKMICKEAIDEVDVSVDAASSKTYRINRGGNYDKLLSNLQFIGGLRRTGELRFFSLHFVVQANNFMEMRDFVKLAQEVHCDRVCFKQLVNWGTYSEKGYLDRAVQMPKHPLHNDFLGLLSDPIFRLPQVYMHDLFHLLEEANT